MLARLDDPASSADDAPVDETELEEVSAGTLTLAIDMQTDAAPDEAAPAA